MQKHTKVYLEHFGYGEQDFIPCERCTERAVDIHHIRGRGPGKDIIENLMALCRKCHDMDKSGLISKDEFQYIHDTFLSGIRKILHV